MEENNQPLVSILIPLYNQERYFKACIRSVCQQTYKNLEVIIVNDGSTDSSPQMARDWAEQDNRIKVIDKQNEGVALARRDGLLKATGPFVAFVDSDDMLPSRAIEILVDHIKRTDVDLVLGAVTKRLGFISRSHVDRIMTFPFYQVINQPDIFDNYFIGFFRNDVFPASMWGRLYRKSRIDIAMQETQLFDKEVNKMGEDQFFNMMLFPFLRSMYRIKDSVYIYRYGGGTFGYNKNFPQLFVSSDKRLKLLDHFNYTQGYGPLFDEYMDCFYHQAAQMIYYKKAGKEEIIDYFSNEIEQRELVPRLEDYYSRQESISKEVGLLMNRDFEGMYQYAYRHAQKFYGSLKYRVFSSVVKMLDSMN